MWRLSARSAGAERLRSEGCARHRSSCESSAQPCRSRVRYTDKIYAAEHPKRGRRNGRWSYRTHARCTLDGLNGEVELSGHPGKEVEGGECLRLGVQRKSPRVMREIINHHQIVFIIRNAGYRGCPHITVNKIKGICRMRRRRKRKSNMTT